MSNIITSEKNGHYLSFNERVHKYTLDGRSVPGGTTFTKGGFPTSQGLMIWMTGKSAEAAIRLAFEEANDTAKIGWDEGEEPTQYAYVPKFTETRIKELVKEAKKKPDELANAAADIGTILHDYAYHTELGKLDIAASILEKATLLPDYPTIQRCIDKFNRWHGQTRDVVVASEAIVAKPCGQHLTDDDRFESGLALVPTYYCLCFAGKFDRLVRRGDKLILSDFKTSSGLYSSQMLQLAAYKLAIEYWMELDVDGLEILRFGKEKGEFEPLLIDDREEVQALERQAMLCRETYAFDRKWSSDRRFAYIPKPKGK